MPMGPQASCLLPEQPALFLGEVFLLLFQEPGVSSRGGRNQCCARLSRGIHVSSLSVARREVLGEGF